MKKVGKILLAFLGVLIIAILLIPVLFKDKIKELVISEFEKSTEAELYFGDFSLNLIKNFPDFTLGLSDMGITGKGLFEGDTLMSVKNLSASVDLNEVLFGETISLKSISLTQPNITIISLADGSANYDIAKASEATPVESTEESAAVSFGIQSFSIEDGDFVYYDQGIEYFMQMANINIDGSGDFEADIFDLITKGQLDLVDMNYAGTDYVTDKTVDMDVILSMDLPNSKYTFKENEISINSFPLRVDGFFALLEDGFGMDLKFSAPRSEFKQLLSLVPGVYTESFNDLKSDGTLSFSGNVTGEYNENSMPAFGLNLKVNDGMFQYPDLPDAIKNVQMSLSVENATGVIEDTRIDLSQLHLEMGSNPLDAKLVVENLKDYRMDANVKGKLILEELTNYFPMEGYELNGTLNLDAEANGVYDSIKNIIPQMNLNVDLTNGRIKTPDLPSPIEDFVIKAQVANQSGRLRDTRIEVSNLALQLDGQPFKGTMTLLNPENFEWDVNVEGNLDLEKLMKLYPMEGMSLKGQISTDLSSKGKMSDLEAQRYARMPTKGNLSLTGFDYKGDVIDQPITISKMVASFTNDKMSLTEYEGTAGSTTYSLSGEITNYLGFALNNEVLKGSLTAQADQLIISEWMTESEAEEVETVSEAMEVVRIPENVLFNLNAAVDKVTYNSLEMNDMKGKVMVKDGIVKLNDSGFKAMNGTVGLTGEYNSKPEQPTFDFKIGAKEISIPSSFQSIDMVQKLAPVTEKMTGLFSTDFSINGALGADMMPDYSTLTGGGLIQILQASLGQSDLMAGLSSVTKLAKVSTATLDKLKMQAEIKNGRLFIKPFDVNLGDYKTTIAGSTGIDGSVDYLLKMNVPAGQVGSQLNSLVSSLTGSNQSLAGDNLILNIGMGGVFSKPEFALKSVSSADGGTVKETVTATVEAKVEEKKEEVKEEIESKVSDAKDSANKVVEAQKDSLKAKVDTLVQAKKDSIATLAADKLGLKKDSVNKTLDNVKGALKGLLKKKKKKNN
ncbi:AsmA-like C-terminal region-containing protein [Roseivirga sp. E12]|uniref:AsmA family protein n=1 Tax=Roseivirga sp. E12 TaxID=2819237 RepID=UPI001ABD2F7E|nr:AsmA-like C-terminal region-containing protein [Roseivirga sp. E12]MBO3699945.1 AsmA family protein [Roseivirga sp. E12]